MSTTAPGPRLGLRANLAQFLLLVTVNALVGGMVGQEQTVLPLLADEEFHLTGYTFLLTYVLAFGITKAATNYFAGTLSDRYGRKPVLLIGWLIAIPVPLLLIWAPSWGWVVAANVLLGINQGLTWSTTVIMKIDLVGPRQRGLAMGFNEAAGYGAVAVTAVLAGYLASRYGLRPAPFLLGLSYAVIGLALSAFFIRETRNFAHLEAAQHTTTSPGTTGDADLTNRQIFTRTSLTEPALSSASQAGLVNNLNFGLSWGLFPILFATTGMSIARIGILVAVYPAVWGLGQIATGALSDRWGRKHLITAGMLTQAAALALIATGGTFAWWAAASALLGAGTAMVYPTLLAAIGDVAHPLWRARAVGVYRLWRDSGYAAGAIVGGVVADLWGLRAAIWAAAAITVISGLVVAVRMYETHTPTPEPTTPTPGQTAN
ncbi:MFS transporter (plasmid) [Rhodococcus pseudokoreensis]|uniref:MFS transporter n=1 Tax=Rhodococcus pseudokoreensis TaxID=2811421 RepID=A0A974ZRQ4_9NOCA|nr:MFS transporter [Rhodococcus pseudokoreensis]QSE87759.1 MFS transporter [Rhodococcus pseudokoreensis]